MAKNENVSLRVCPPRDRQIVLQADKPWEKSKYITLYCSVIEDNGVYKMFYTHNNDDDKSNTGLLYAESKDGIHWEKPELGIVSYKGSKANNMLGILANEGSVIFEPDAPEEERYKCFVDHLRKGTFLHTSADGIHWRISEKPLGDFLLDSQNVAFFDQRIIIRKQGWCSCGAVPVLCVLSCTVRSNTHQYFAGETRYSFLNNGSHGHSVPIVNGCVQLYGCKYAADKFEKTENGIQPVTIIEFESVTDADKLEITYRIK